MTTIDVWARTQRIVVNPATQTVSVVNAGPQGPPGSGGEGGGGGDAVLIDEDDMASNSDEHAPSQQSVVVYVANEIAAAVAAAIVTAVNTAKTEIIDGAPGALDTLNEIAAALADDANYAAAITAALALKAPLASPSFTGTVTLPTSLTGVLRADAGVVSSDANVTDIVDAASTTVAGKVELATTAELETATDAVRAISPSVMGDIETLVNMDWFLDDDTMATDSNVKTTSQSAARAYAQAMRDAAIADRQLNTFHVKEFTASSEARPTLPVGARVLWINITNTNLPSNAINGDQLLNKLVI